MNAFRTVILSGLIIFISGIQHQAFSMNVDGYVTVSKLFVRSKPTTKSKKVGSLTLAEKVTVVEKSKKKEIIGGKRAYWYRISNVGKAGWVFGGFLSWKPVLTKKEKITQMGGTYYYGKNRNRLNERTLYLSGEKYTERLFNSKTGITDEYKGKVVYQANDITLIPKSRMARPSVYIDTPRNAQEREAYSYAYRMWDDHPERLKKISRLSIKKGFRKLYIIKIDNKILLVTPAKGKKIKKNKITKIKKIFPAYIKQ